MVLTSAQAWVSDASGSWHSVCKQEAQSQCRTLRKLVSYDVPRGSMPDGSTSWRDRSY